MSHFEPTPALYMTQRIMDRIQKIANLPTHKYNPVFSAVHDELSRAELPADAGLTPEAKRILNRNLDRLGVQP